MTTHTAKLAREAALTDALRAVDAIISDSTASPQALKIVAAIRALRDASPSRVSTLHPVDYLSKVQQDARSNWSSDVASIATVETPLGTLSATVWRRPWTGKHGQRTAWAAEYYLDGNPITIAEIRAAGLAQRPTTRNRK